MVGEEMSSQLQDQINRLQQLRSQVQMITQQRQQMSAPSGKLTGFYLLIEHWYCRDRHLIFMSKIKTIRIHWEDLIYLTS